MPLQIADELRDICRAILEEGSSAADWQRCSSGDFFQSEHFCGGFESGDGLFWFSHHSADGDEHWFSMSPDQVRRIAAGEKIDLPLERPK